MHKMKVIIADRDCKYMNKLVDYLSSFCLSRFRVSAFTQPAVLEDYLRCSSEKINILLAHPDFLNLGPDFYQNVELILILSDGSIECCSDKYQLVNKYIPGEKLVSELLNRYTEKNSHISKFITGSKRTNLIAVYSAAGGSGKSSVTLGLAARLGRMGKTTLVLCLEGLNSISPGVICKNNAFSQILLTAIDDPGSLPIKVENCRSVDTLHGFEFVGPPGCFYEISELQGKDAGLLLDGLIQMGRYDYILVDMESKPDNLTLEIMKRADKVILLIVPDVCSNWKTDQFLQQICKEESFNNASFTNKVLPVLNKYDGGNKGSLEKYGLNCPLTIPVFSDLWHCNDGNYQFDINQKFSTSLTGIVNALTETDDFERS